MSQNSCEFQAEFRVERDSRLVGEVCHELVEAPAHEEANPHVESEPGARWSAEVLLDRNLPGGEVDVEINRSELVDQIERHPRRKHNLHTPQQILRRIERLSFDNDGDDENGFG